MNETCDRARRGERTLVTTLTKKMSEDLTSYLLAATSSRTTWGAPSGRGRRSGWRRGPREVAGEG